ncbi:MAG: MBL fold metallo-hydrolase [Myxococcota bacterium]|nr:MBL fold metallo-hydrolase [Myxococcota bacterium]
MDLTFNGHACVTLRDSDGRVVVMDPYQTGALGGRLTHAPVRERANVVTVSHYHTDHSRVTSDLAAPGGGLPPVVDHSSAVAGLEFVVRPTYHDRYGGTRMGMTGMVAFDLDGIRVAHLGDIGCDLTPRDLEVLGDVDLLLWPVGGTYTLGPEDAQTVLDLVRPRLAIPLHYENERCRLGMLPIDALAPQLSHPPSRPGTSSWTSTDGLPEETEVRILEPLL